LTSDGISTADWDRVHELAVEVANASGARDEDARERAARQLTGLLDELQEKYGPLPSLLATRADYVDRPEDQEYWLLAAYEAAVRRDDPKNLTWIAESVARFYVETRPERANAEEWLARLEQHLQRFPAAWEAGQLVLLRNALSQSSGLGNDGGND
jgi:hypothetical protein